MTFVFEDKLKIFIVDERSSTVARSHASKWTGAKTNAVPNGAFVKEFPQPMHTTVSMCAFPMAHPDTAIIVLGPEHTHAFAKTNCVLAEGAPVGIIVDCFSPSELSPHSLKVLSELAAKHNGLFAAFSMSHRAQVDAFFHQMMFVARLHCESTRKLRQSRSILRRGKQVWPRRCVFPLIAIAIAISVVLLVYFCW